ncbi:hypothetical protein ACSBR1_043567 [Camellia fascicularis]
MVSTLRRRRFGSELMFSDNCRMPVSFLKYCQFAIIIHDDGVILKALHASQHGGLEAKYFEEKAALEAKYQKLYGPLYDKRCEIVNGVVEVEGVTSEATMDLEDDKTTEDMSNAEKGVPDFWVNAMKNSSGERDEEALKYLKGIKWFRIDNLKGFKLETEIEWYLGKCLTRKILKKKPKKGLRMQNLLQRLKIPPEVPEDDDDIDVDIVRLATLYMLKSGMLEYGILYI